MTHTPLIHRLARRVARPFRKATAPPVNESPALLAAWYADQPAAPGCLMLAGDSHAQTLATRLAERANERNLPRPWPDLMDRYGVRNQGIGGQTASDVSRRFSELERHAPTRLFLIAGTNDVSAHGHGEDVLELLCVAYQRVGAERLVLATILPCCLPNPVDTAAFNAKVETINRQIGLFADARRIPLLDLHGLTTDGERKLDARLTYDGVHLNTPATGKPIPKGRQNSSYACSKKPSE